MSLFGNLREYDPDDDDWTEYNEQMENFFLANDIIEDSKKRAIFLSSCGGKTYSLIRSLFTPTKPAGKTFVEIIESVKSHQSPKHSVIMERYKFNKRDRMVNETAAQYVASLRKMCQHCDYGEACEEMIRDRFICGVENDCVQQKLLSESTLTLDGVIKIAASMDTTTQNIKTSNEEFSVPMKGSTQFKFGFVDNITCFRCGGRYAEDSSGFEDRECFYCHKKGHIAKILIPNREHDGTRPQRDRKVPMYLKDYNTAGYTTFNDNVNENEMQRPQRDRKLPAYLEDYAA